MPSLQLDESRGDENMFAPAQPVSQPGLSSDDSDFPATPNDADIDLDTRGRAPKFFGKRGMAPKFFGKKSLGLSEAEDDVQFVDTRGSPRFFGKKRSEEGDSDFDVLDVEQRAAPRFFGKKSANVGMSLESRGSPRFFGKKSIDGYDIKLETRGSPRFFGKRGSPRFFGKRHPDGPPEPNEDIVLTLKSNPGYYVHPHYHQAHTHPQHTKPYFGKESTEENSSYTSGASPRFFGNFNLMTGGTPKFSGKTSSDYANGDRSSTQGSDDQSSIVDIETRGRAPKFFGKRSVPAHFEGDVDSDKHHVVKRAVPDDSDYFYEIFRRGAPKFIGKREYVYPAESFPLFVGKRFNLYRPPRQFSIPGPYMSAREFKETFRRSDPFFMGKRTAEFGEDEFDDFEGDDDDVEVDERGSPRFPGKRGAPRFPGKRGAPRFFGKRGPPRFVGRRGAPKFIGRRGAPRFVGKRGAPRFVGKRDQDDGYLDNIYEYGLPYDLEPEYVEEYEDGAAKRQAAPRFIGKKRSEGDLSERDYAQLLEALSRLEAIKKIKERIQNEKRRYGPSMVGRRSELTDEPVGEYEEAPLRR